MSKILSALQLQEADCHMMLSEPIASIDLMERAANSCFHWIRSHRFDPKTIRVFCGPGNNGGDGAALARLFSQAGSEVHTYLFGERSGWSPDLTENVRRLNGCPGVTVHHITEASTLPTEGKGELWIDALFGTGLTRSLAGIYDEIIGIINSSGSDVISIDIPSGLQADSIPMISDPIVAAKDTLTFHCPKLTFFFPESGSFVGRWHILDIGIDDDHTSSVESDHWILDEQEIKTRFRPRERFTHKGTYGHGLLIAGGDGKFGAAVLSSRSALRSGIGLLTVSSPKEGEHILQTSVPEAMYIPNDSRFDFEKFDAVAFGPGCGIGSTVSELLATVLTSIKSPIIIDADGLNILSSEKELLHRLPENCILTPHPKEFERLTFPIANDFERMELQRDFAVRYKVVLVLKGAYTRIATPDGRIWFNITGNAGLARGGSGDVLTGMVLSFLAQGYHPEDAALLAVFIHGKAADVAASKKSMQSMSFEDMMEALPDVFLSLER